MVYFGARYYDARLGRWTTVDPPLVKGEYLPKPSDFDNEHDMYWYSLNDKTNELPGMGGVFNPVNLNAYQYAGNNPVVLVDPDGEKIAVIAAGGDISVSVGVNAQKGYIVQYGKGVEFKVYKVNFTEVEVGRGASINTTITFYGSRTVEDFFNSDSWVSGSTMLFGYIHVGVAIGSDNKGKFLLGLSAGLKKSSSKGIFKYGTTFTTPMNLYKDPKLLDRNSKEAKAIEKFFKKVFGKDQVNTGKK